MSNDNSNSIFDFGSVDPNLCALRGYDDCETCFCRLSILMRITKNVKQLQRGANLMTLDRLNLFYKSHVKHSIQYIQDLNRQLDKLDSEQQVRRVV
jgi:hypothetical protein